MLKKLKKNLEKIAMREIFKKNVRFVWTRTFEKNVTNAIFNFIKVLSTVRKWI